MSGKDPKNIESESSKTPKNSSSSFLNICKTVTFIIVWSWILFQLGSEVYIRFLRPSTSWKEYKGEWAIITGASYGIGEQYAKSLAKRGLNLILISRNKGNLEKVSQNLLKQYPNIKTHLLEADFSKDPYENITNQLKDLDNISVLINNVGGALHHARLNFYEIPLEDIDYDVNLNLLSTLKMTRIFLNKMVRSDKGRVFIVSSLSAYGVPGMTLYSSLKSALITLAHCIQLELELIHSKVEIVVTTPGFVETPGERKTTRGKKGPLEIQVEELVENELDYFGAQSVLVSSLSHFFLKELTVFSKFLPISIQAIAFRELEKDFVS